jgi:hypothetical protein
MRAKQAVRIWMRQRNSQEIATDPMPRYLAEALMMVISTTGEYDGKPVSVAIIKPMALNISGEW